MRDIAGKLEQLKSDMESTEKKMQAFQKKVDHLAKTQGKHKQASKPHK